MLLPGVCGRHPHLQLPAHPAVTPTASAWAQPHKAQEHHLDPSKSSPWPQPCPCPDQDLSHIHLWGGLFPAVPSPSN